MDRFTGNSRSPAPVTSRVAAITCFAIAVLACTASFITSAQANMRTHGSRGGGGGFSMGAASMAIGMVYGTAMIQGTQRSQQPPQVQMRSKSEPRPKKDAAKNNGSATKKKQDVNTARKDNSSSNAKKKDEPNPSSRKDTPVHAKAPLPVPVASVPNTPQVPPANVATPTPTFPALSTPTNCRDCQELWQAIVQYQQKIEKDINKLEVAENGLRDRGIARKQLVNLLGRSGTIDRIYYEQLIKNLDEATDALRAANDQLRDLIEREKAELAMRMEQYQKCAEAHCRNEVSQTEVPRRQYRTTYRYELPPYYGLTTSTSRPQQREPIPASTPRTSPCPDHHAELTNSERVFHRLYVVGPSGSPYIDNIPVVRSIPAFQLLGAAMGVALQTHWTQITNQIRNTLEAPNRQASGSTSRTLDRPSLSAFEAELIKLHELAKPCEEVTIVLLGHGGGETKGARNYRNEDGTLSADFSSVGVVRIGPEEQDRIRSDRLNELVKGFNPDVSVTIFAEACYGALMGGKGGVEQTQLVQVIGPTDTVPGADFPGRSEMFEDFIDAVNNAADAMPNGRVTTREVNSHLARSGWPMGTAAVPNQ